MRYKIKVSGKDRIIVLWRALVKVVRGAIRGFVVKKRKGLLFIGKEVTISHGNHIFCGKNVKFEDYCEIQGLCTGGLHFGDNVTIGRGVMIRPSSYYGIDEGEGLIIGNNSSIGPYGFIGCSGHITIGNNVMIGPRCNFFAENHVFQNSRQSIKSQGVRRQSIVIGDNCWIGSNVIILAGVKIGSGCVIGAGTLISKDIPDNSVVIDHREKYIRNRID